VRDLAFPKMAQPASVGLEADPRTYHDDKLIDKEAGLNGHGDGVGGVAVAHKPQSRLTHDPAVTFEEYYYYAQQTRAEEESHPKVGYETTIMSLLWPSKSGPAAGEDGVTKVDSKHHLQDRQVRAHISDEEWANASRALRTATRGAIFYLITTDILGPFGLPFAFASVGWG
jgi:hypothetical protein